MQKARHSAKPQAKLLTILLAMTLILGAAFPVFAQAAAVTATPSAHTIRVDGEEVKFNAYLIGDNNYIMLRDIAYALSGSAAQFDVTWSAAQKTISITTGKAYTRVGGEMTAKGGASKDAALTASKILLDGKSQTFTAYTIGDNNYVQLAEVGKILDFAVTYDAASKTALIYTASDFAMTKVTLNIFAAASMTETITAIKDLYAAAAPNVTLVATFDSSGTLLTQIQAGAEADVFISAAQKQMNTLDDENALTPGTRFNLVENKVALVVPDGNPANIHSFEDAAKANLIALGNSDVPVGQYSEEIFRNMGVWDAMQKNITWGTNVKEVTSWVSEGVVDCGVVYATDAYSAKLTVVAAPPAGTLKTPVVYPAAALAASKHQSAAATYLDFLKTAKASAVFESVGFSIAS
jgi:molybdate transport system substrate-binding protein